MSDVKALTDADIERLGLRSPSLVTVNADTVRRLLATLDAARAKTPAAPEAHGRDFWEREYERRALASPDGDTTPEEPA